jgi:hypothetical protein
MLVRKKARQIGLAATLAALLVSTAAAPTFAQSVQRSEARSRAMQECSALQGRYPDDEWGGTQNYHYRACMADHGQPE